MNTTLLPKEITQDCDRCRYIIAFVAMVEIIYLMYCTFDDVLN